mmetsp:Transcript_26738/g.49084  ORF Transcript_26738/g.49084 Transcript_26738/m.49084 type:complete len:318 (+) Transcript_26738:61-1014(+)
MSDEADDPGLTNTIEEGGASYANAQGLAMSLIVIFALVLPMCMQVQNTVTEEQLQRATFYSLVCLEADFREFAISTLEDPNTGDIGTYRTELFSFQKKLPPWGVLDIKETLRDTSLWSGIKDVHDCEEYPVARASVAGLYEHFPIAAMEEWVLLHSEIKIRGDVLVEKAAWAFNLALVGFLSSLLLYMSLTISPGKEDETGDVMRSWSRVGMPCLILNIVLLLGTVAMLLVAQDEWVDALYPFHMRDGYFFSAPNRQLVVFLFVPGTILYILGTFAAYCLARRTKRHKLFEVVDYGEETSSDAGDTVRPVAWAPGSM